MSAEVPLHGGAQGGGEVAAHVDEQRAVGQSLAPLPSQAFVTPSEPKRRGPGRPRGRRGLGRPPASSRTGPREDEKDRDYRPPPNIAHDFKLSMLADIPRRSVRTVLLQTRPKPSEVDKQVRRESYDGYSPSLPLPTSPKSSYEPMPVEELDNFTCRWRGCKIAEEFEDLEALSGHLIEDHVKSQRGLCGKRKNSRGFICEWDSCTEERPFHGMQEVQSHLRARHIGIKPKESLPNSSLHTLRSTQDGALEKSNEDDTIDVDDSYQDEKRHQKVSTTSSPSSQPSTLEQPVKRKRGRPPMTPQQRAQAAALREQRKRKQEEERMLAALKRAKRQRRSEDQETIKQEDKKQIPSSVPTLSPTLPAVNRAERQPLLSMHSPETSNEPSSGEIDPVVFSRCAAAAPKKRLLMRVMAHNPSALQTSESIG